VSSLTCCGCSITGKINSATTATIRFDKSDFLQLGDINYLDEVVINSISQKRLLYRGNAMPLRGTTKHEKELVLSSQSSVAHAPKRV